MTAIECAMRLGVSGPRVGQIERAEVEGSLRISTMMRAAAALECRYLSVVLPDDPLEDIVLRRAYHLALEERSLPASVALGGTPVGPRTEEDLEIRTLELVDSRGLWRERNVSGPSQS
jgi:transcriptional regulator with XRE-family HTH domain